MGQLKLTDQADLGLIYELELPRYSTEFIQQHNMTKEKFIAIFNGSPSIGYECAGKPIGGMIFFNNEAHMAVAPEFHGKWGILWKPTLVWLFALKDPITIKIEITNTKCIRFMDRQWKRLATDAEFATFEMTSKGHFLFNEK